MRAIGNHFSITALICIFIFLNLYSCQKNSLWVGNKEFITFNYSKGTLGGPKVSSTPIDQSPFIDYDNITAFDDNFGTVQVIIDGIRVQSKTNNYTISGFNIYEKDKNKFEKQDEFTKQPDNTETDIAAVLVLDMSTSLESVVKDLKIYAKSFVDKIVGSTNNSKVAVVFFSGKNDITTTKFYDYTDADQLKSEIDNFNNYKSRTALFEATVKGIDLLESLSFLGSKALVVFTDGGDNDSDNPSKLKSQIAVSEILRICIGLKGEDFDKDDLVAIADSKSNYIVANKKEDLKKIFETVAKQIVSVYKIIYYRSDQVLDKDIEIKFEFEVNKIK